MTNHNQHNIERTENGYQFVMLIGSSAIVHKTESLREMIAWIQSKEPCA